MIGLDDTKLERENRREIWKSWWTGWESWRFVSSLFFSIEPWLNWYIDDQNKPKQWNKARVYNNYYSHMFSIYKANWIVGLDRDWIDWYTREEIPQCRGQEDHWWIRLENRVNKRLIGEFFVRKIEFHSSMHLLFQGELRSVENTEILEHTTNQPLICEKNDAENIYICKCYFAVDFTSINIRLDFCDSGWSLSLNFIYFNLSCLEILKTVSIKSWSLANPDIFNELRLSASVFNHTIQVHCSSSSSRGMWSYA